MNKNIIRVAPHFLHDEFQCKCNYPDCSKERAVDVILVDFLEQLREEINILYLGDDEYKIFIHSGWRCPSYNNDVNGAKHSKHLIGIAADIVIKNKFDIIPPEKVFKILDKIHPYDCGIGLYAGFVHFDRRKKKARWRG